MASLGLWATVKHMENAILVSQEDRSLGRLYVTLRDGARQVGDRNCIRNNVVGSILLGNS